MGKHGNKRHRHSQRATSQSGHKRSGQRSGPRRYIIWPLASIVMVAAVAAAWSVFKDDSPTSTAAGPVNKRSEALLAAKQETKPVKPKPDPVLAGARLEIPEPEFDFGFVPQNAKVSHEFWLHSAGTDTLKIVKINPG